MNIVELLNQTKLFQSKSEIRRLIEQKGLKLDWETILDINYDVYAPDVDENEIHINPTIEGAKKNNIPCCNKVIVHNISDFYSSKIQELQDTHVYKIINNFLTRFGLKSFKSKDLSDKQLEYLYNNCVFTNFFVLSKGKKLQYTWILEME